VAISCRESQPGDLVTCKNHVRELTRDQFAAIQEFSVDTTGGIGDGERRRVLRTRIKLSPKVPALQLLASSLKIFADKLEVSLDDVIIARLQAARKRLGDDGK
jgi:hypothetical protein